MNTLSLFNPRVAERLLDSLSCSSIAPARSLPRADIRETDEAYLLDLELPGLALEDISVSIKNRLLSVSGGKKEEAETSGRWLMRERASVSFERHFNLPEDSDTEGLSAELTNGVLTVRIPRRAESKPRQISITAA